MLGGRLALFVFTTLLATTPCSASKVQYHKENGVN